MHQWRMVSIALRSVLQGATEIREAIIYTAEAIECSQCKLVPGLPLACAIIFYARARADKLVVYIVATTIQPHTPGRQDDLRCRHLYHIHVETSELCLHTLHCQCICTWNHL